MRVPKELTGDAKKFWQDNSPLVEKMGLLTDADKSTFTLLCVTWSKLIAADADDIDTIKWVCLNKQYQSLSQRFGLDPLSRKKLGVVAEQETPDEFGI